MIANARRPYTLPVNLFSILKRESVVVKVKPVKAVGHILPVYKVARMKYHKSGNSVHRSSHKVIIIAHAQYVRVGKFIVHQRICKRAVAIVGRP